MDLQDIMHDVDHPFVIDLVPCNGMSRGPLFLEFGEYPCLVGFQPLRVIEFISLSRVLLPFQNGMIFSL